jgi:alanyl-tRNA synthetase
MLGTEMFGLDPSHPMVCVFRGQMKQDNLVREAVGMNPKRIIRMNKSDIFWMSGPTGPCLKSTKTSTPRGDDAIDLEDDSRFIEF